jgi:alpha-tubulin suppressor-like RCC1 family protein
MTPTTASAGGIAFDLLTSRRGDVCGLDASGTVYCLSPFEAAPPTAASGPVLASLDGGDEHLCGFTPTGEGYCWGNGSFGRLGNGNATANREEPDAVVGGHVFSRIQAGGEHTCALSVDGPTYCWGSNVARQVGDVPGISIDAPTLVDTPETFVELAAGGAHNCALSAAGAAYCWGRNIEGELGNGTSTGTHALPQEVLGGRAFAQIFAGPFHTCALTEAGVAYCWGRSGGRLGVGHLNEETTPTPVSGGLTFRSLVLGEEHTCGLTTAGDAYCWGGNGLSQLGNGTSTPWTAVPMRTVAF